MKYTKLLTIFTLPIMWMVYFIFEILTGRVTNTTTFIGNIALIIIFILCGYIIYFISSKFNKGLSKNQLFIVFLILMFIDQGIKIIIKLFFFNQYIEIIKDFLYFSPIINSDGSWLNARFNTGINFSLLILINVISLFIFFELYRYLSNKNGRNFWTDSCFLFIFSGALCSLIDKVFYGGSLDFIGISSLFVADIKDIYINLGVLFFVIAIYESGYLTSSEDTTFKDDLASIKKFLIFIKNDLSSIFFNNKK